MDFQTFVNKFRNNVLNEEETQIDELTKKSREIVKKYIDDGTPGRHQPRYSFNHLFGDTSTMRMVIPYAGEAGDRATKMFKRIVQDLGWEPAFTEKKVKQKRRREGGEEYIEELTIPDLQMKKTETRTIPKGPRAGQTIEREIKTSLGKIIQSEGTSEEKEWWKEHQNSLREMRNVRAWFLKPYLNFFDGSEKPIIILSRHPIDVARMSDFSTTRSCHSEGRSYFHCALAESKGHGMVAFLVSAKDWKEWDLKDALEEDEIFGDSDIGLRGPEPIGRVRLRKLYNKKTEDEFATVENRVYGLDIPDFLPSVRKWIRENQEQYWKDKDGNFDSDILDDTDWISVGGDYFDTEISDQIAMMFEDTEFEEEAEEFLSKSYEHEDYFDEGQDAEFAQAERALAAMNGRLRDQIEHIGASVDIEEGWDGMPFVINCWMGLRLEFEVGEDWRENENYVKMPSYPENTWTQIREVKEEIEEVIQNAADYLPYNRELELNALGDGSGFEILLHSSNSFDDVGRVEEEIETYLGVDANFLKIKTAVQTWLESEGYLPPGPLQKRVEEITQMEFDNIEFEYDEEDPAEGITLRSWNREEEDHYIPVEKYFYADPETGLTVFDDFRLNLSNFSAQVALNAKLRSVFRRGVRRARRHARSQMTFQGMPAQKIDIMRLPDTLTFKFKVGPHPIKGFVRTASQADITDDQRKRMKETATFPVSYSFELETPYDASEEQVEFLVELAKYLDQNIDDITAAVREVTDEIWNNIANEYKQKAQAAAERAEQVQQLSPTAIDQARDRLREIVKKAIKKKLQEQTGFETRLFQVSLRLSFDPGQGGGIEQKLNRIRAIKGVTVVGHEEGSTLSGKRVIEARIKFHPESDSVRPASYVNQVLVPEINSSKLVPGVKVIDIIKGSLKRLDK